MEMIEAALIFGALSQDTRLAILRLLIAAGPNGLPAGQIADRLGLPTSTTSFHLGALEWAGLTQATRQSRQVIQSLLFLARAEAVHASPHHESIDVRRELEAIREFYEATASEAGVELVLAPGPDIRMGFDRPPSPGSRDQSRRDGLVGRNRAGHAKAAPLVCAAHCPAPGPPMRPVRHDDRGADHAVRAWGSGERHPHRVLQHASRPARGGRFGRAGGDDGSVSALRQDCPAHASADPARRCRGWRSCARLLVPDRNLRHVPGAAFIRHRRHGQDGRAARG